MAVYGVGAYHGKDVTKDFIENECFCIGHGKSEATSLYEMLRRAKIGDLVYIKSFVPKQSEVLNVKAIGFITGRMIKSYNTDTSGYLGYGREIKWVKDFSDSSIKIDLSKEDKVNNVYSNTMYEEYSARIVKEIIDLLTDLG